MKLKKVFVILMILSLCIFSFCSCSDKNSEDASSLDTSITGTWTESRYNSGFTFNEDGTGFDIFWELPFTYSTSSDETDESKTLTITYDDETYGSAIYTYEINGSTLSMGLKDENAIYDYEKDE